jgi:hypothetical protein
MSGAMKASGRPERKVFAQFFSPGTFFSETSTAPLEDGTIEEAVRLSKGIAERYNATPYAFDIVTKLVAPPVEDGEGGVMPVAPKEVERKGRFFIGGRLIRFEEMVSAEGEKAIIVGNMRGNGWPICIENTNSYKSTQPFTEADTVVDPDTGEILFSGSSPDLVKYRAEKLEEWKTSDR